MRGRLFERVYYGEYSKGLQARCRVPDLDAYIRGSGSGSGGGRSSGNGGSSDDEI